MSAEKKTKGEATRERLLDIALRLFAQHGFEATTMRDIADAAGLSLGATYRHYARKEDLVLALYARLAATLAKRVARLPAGPMSQRFHAAMELKLKLLQPHRRAFGALVATALNPEVELGVLSQSTGEIRTRVREIFARVVSEATDRPAPPQDAQLAELLYAVHLLLLLIWTQDRSARAGATRALLALTRDLLAAASLLSLRPAASTLARISDALAPFLHPHRTRKRSGATQRREP